MEFSQQSIAQQNTHMLKQIKFQKSSSNPPTPFQELTVKYASRTLDGEVVACWGCCPPTVSRILPVNWVHLFVHTAIWSAVTVNVTWQGTGDREGYITKIESPLCKRIDVTTTNHNGASSSYVGPIHRNQLPDRRRDVRMKPVQVWLDHLGEREWAQNFSR